MVSTVQFTSSRVETVCTGFGGERGAGCANGCVQLCSANIYEYVRNKELFNDA